MAAGLRGLVGFVESSGACNLEATFPSRLECLVDLEALANCTACTEGSSSRDPLFKLLRCSAGLIAALGSGRLARFLLVVGPLVCTSRARFSRNPDSSRSEVSLKN